MLHVGDRVPDFTLPLAYADGRRDAVAFSTLLGRGPIVIAFYPLAFTRVCTTENCELRDAQETLRGLGAAVVVGFSIDTAPTNVHYAKLHDLPHGLFSDPNRQVVERIWETQTVIGVERVAKRGWLVVDAEGVVRERWITDIPGEWSGLAPIQAALEKLRDAPPKR